MTYPEDEDRTLIKASAGFGHAVLGVSAAVEQDKNDALPVGTRINEFEIIGLVGVGGFGIVYLAHDHSLGRNVALKEYMPATLASRKEGLSVGVRSMRDVETFDAGLKSFINEGRLLARFDHPSLVKVYRFWEANGTAYMVMPFYEGLTLKQTLSSMGTPPSEVWLKALLAQLVNAIEILHRESCFHRDISPDNILLLEGGRPVLLDFGAARRVIGDRAQNLTVILKHGYAPVEQYAEIPDMRQGAWTDIYSLAAVVHYAITGGPPPPSVARVVSDTMPPLQQAARGRYSESFLRGIDCALAVNPEQRPQSVAELRTLLSLNNGVAAMRRPPQEQAEKLVDKPTAGPMRWLWIVVAAALLFAGAGTFFILNRGSGPAAPITNMDPTVKVPVTTSDAQTTSPMPTVAQAKLVAALPSVSSAVNPIDALMQVYEQRDQGRLVTVGVDKTRVKIGQDKLRFQVRSVKAGYLYVFMVGTDGTHMNLLFPNALDRNNKVSAGKKMSLPRAGWAMTAAGPPGTDQFVVVVSEQPRDFTSAGIIDVGPFAEFPHDAIDKAYRSTEGPTKLAGEPVCASNTNCSPAYGAAQFSISETD